MSKKSNKILDLNIDCCSYTVSSKIFKKKILDYCAYCEHSAYNVIRLPLHVHMLNNLLTRYEIDSLFLFYCFCAAQQQLLSHNHDEEWCRLFLEQGLLACGGQLHLCGKVIENAEYCAVLFRSWPTTKAVFVAPYSKYNDAVLRRNYMQFKFYKILRAYHMVQ